MSLYKCKVLSNSGSVHVMKMDGFSKEDIVENLRKNNFIIIDVKSIKNIYNLRITAKVQSLKPKELALFCKQMNIMLRSGITIVKCIEILSVQTENKKLCSLLQLIYKELLTGSTLSESIYNHKKSFPALFVTMVQAGELSGNINLVMERMAAHYSKENKIENKVKSALTYPIILFIVATAVVIFLLVKVMPTFVDLYRSSGVPLPYITSMLLNISQLIKNLWVATLVLIVVFIIAIKRLNKNNYDVRHGLDSIKLRLPFYGALKIKLVAVCFTRTLSTLLSSGVPLIEGIETVSMIVGNEYITKLILNAREEVKNGSSLAFSVSNQNLFPPIVHSMIKLGEESGELEDMLDKVADFFDEEVENAIQKLITMVEPIMIVVMALIVGFIMLAMITPMFDMINTVQ